MSDKNLVLLKTIKKFPCLYNHQLSEYSRKDVTDKAWSEVANETKQTASDCKEKWKNLRYSFVRSLKPNPDGSYKKKYYLNDDMEFILPYVRVLASKVSESNFLDDILDEEDIDSPDNNPDLRLTTQVQFAKANETQPPQSSDPPKKKTKLSDRYTEHNIYNTLQATNTYVSRRIFLLSLLPEVTVLTELQMRSFRRNVLKLLDDITEQNTESTLWATQQNSVQHDILKNELS